eukprot:15475199-Alexandrium_andersonii.AAC.1
MQHLPGMFPQCCSRVVPAARRVVGECFLRLLIGTALPLPSVRKDRHAFLGGPGPRAPMGAGQKLWTKACTA